MTTLYQIDANAYQPSVPANENFKAVAPAGIFGKDHVNSSGLTFAFYGGVLLVDGVLTTVADGTTALTASVTNYIEATRAGVVSNNSSSFTAGRIPLFTAATNTTVITTLTDYRAWVEPRWVGSVLAKTWPSDASYTLTAAEARARVIELSGATLTAQRDLTVPDYGEWFIRNDTGGGQAIRVVPAGSPSVGVVIATAMGAWVYANGTDVKRSTADV